MGKVDERSPRISLTDEALGRLSEALDRDGVVSVSLFGSQARGKQGPLSDVDVGVWADPQGKRDPDLELELAAAAARALGTDELDLVILNDAPPLLQHRVIGSQRIVLDRDARSRIRLESRALLDYLDTDPLRQELARGLEHRLAENRFGRR